MNKIDKDIQEKIILLTGATSGIGIKITEDLLKKGYRVIATGRKIEKLGLLKEKYNEEHLKIKLLDFSKSSSVEDFDISFGKINGFINAAGISPLLPAMFTNYEILLNSMQVNFLGPVTLINKLLKKRRFSRGSSIILLTSIAGSNVSNIGLSNYSASKAALIGYIKSVALEIAPHIRINSIAPGMVDTGTGMFADTIEKMTKDEIKKDLSMYPLGRFGTPEDVSNMVDFLLSSKSSWITGQNLVIDGGRTLR
ncbi:SDR family oxidoreductase [Vallitalea sediminicola]